MQWHSGPPGSSLQAQSASVRLIDLFTSSGLAPDSAAAACSIGRIKASKVNNERPARSRAL